MKAIAMFEDSVLVVAHPDDECLWFSSILTKVKEIVFCYEDHPRDVNLGPARRTALHNYPIEKVTSLGLIEPDTFNSIDWDNPLGTAYGIELTDKTTTRRYIKNFDLLKESVSERVRDAKNVFTHNPWGEYGHADHAQVFQVMRRLQRLYGFNLWHSNYCGSRCIPHYLNYVSGFSSEYITLATEVTLAELLAEHYNRNHCWTWYQDYKWFNEESFINALDPPEDQIGYGSLLPLNLLVLDVKQKLTKKKSKYSLMKKNLKNIHQRIAQ